MKIIEKSWFFAEIRTKIRKSLKNFANILNLERSCRSWKMLKHEYLVAKIGFDTEENEPSEVWSFSLSKTGLIASNLSTKVPFRPLRDPHAAAAAHRAAGEGRPGHGGDHARGDADAAARSALHEPRRRRPGPVAFKGEFQSFKGFFDENERELFSGGIFTWTDAAFIPSG